MNSAPFDADDPSNNDEIAPFTEKQVQSFLRAVKLVALLLILAAIPTAYYLGVNRGYEQSQRTLFESQRAQILEILQESPETYQKLQVNRGRDGTAYLSGDVPFKRDRDWLRSRVQEEIGQPFADAIVRLVGMEAWR